MKNSYTICCHLTPEIQVNARKIYESVAIAIDDEITLFCDRETALRIGKEITKSVKALPPFTDADTMTEPF